jgi:autotransporter-associated beta strand protein
VPKGLAIDEWRAVASIDSARAKLVAQSKKYPDAFYQGKRAFGKIPASGYQAFSSAASDPLTPQSARVLTSQIKALGSVLNTEATSSSSSNPINSFADKSGSPINNQITEADIWKTDGNTVYFFNQLRGLQVIDVSDPGNPKLTASLRMPATGQDLYIVPAESPGEKLAVLLARNYNSWSSTDVVVVKIAGGGAQEISRTSLNGGLCDSRMLGNRLYTVTTDWSAYYDAAGVNSGVRGSTNLSQHLILGDGSQVEEKQHKLPLFAGSALIAAGNNWLAVSAYQWESDAGSSQIHLFSLDDSGATPLSSAPIKTSGWIYDKFKISYANECLSVVSVSYENDPTSGRWWWSPVTKLENFDVNGNLLASLEIVRDERLYATRFTGGKMYAVTFRQTDPLWVVDLADIQKPVISGKLEIPGFSTHLEPIGENGEFLFAIGLDAGAVVASLFDVHDPSAPTRVSRVELDESNWGYSEAVWNEKALKVLPEAGLALIPFTSGYTFNSSTGARTTRPSFVQLVDISLLQGGTLKLRGRLEHNFEPRRAALVNGILTSISQKELITANIDDRDNPAVLAEVSLAWPVNQVIQSGNFVLQISDGSSAVWSGESAVVRISKASSENAILADVDLGEGTVQDAVLRDSKLYVLRKNWGPYTPMVRFVRRPGRIMPSASEPELALDIYDASALPSLPRLGSTAVPMTNADTNCTVSNLLWATDTLPVVITQARPWYGYYYPMICGVGGGDIALPALARMSASSLAMAPESEKRKPSLRAAMIRAFDVSNPKTPTALPGMPLPGTSSTVITVSAAGDGMVVFGYGESPSPWRPLGWPSELDPPLECFNRVGMVNLSNPRRPIVGAPVLLPGKLFAVTDISRSGFLAFTESVSSESTLADKDPRSGAAVYSTPTEPTRQVQVSLVADSQASMFASVAVGLDAKLTAQGRNLYCATANRIERFTLSDEASFTNTGSATTTWTPAEIQMRGISLVGAYGNQLMRVSWPGLDGVVENFKASQWFDLTRLTLSLDGSLLVPMGDYGFEKLTPVSASLMNLSAPNWALRRPIPGDLITIPQIRVSELRTVNVSSPEILKGTLSPATGDMLNLNISAGPASMAEAVPLNIAIRPAEYGVISNDAIAPQPISNPVGNYGNLTLSNQTSNRLEPLNYSAPLVFAQGAMLPGTTSFNGPNTAMLLGGGSVVVQQGGDLLLDNRHLNAPLIVGVVGVPVPESNGSSLLISAPNSVSGGLQMVGGGIGAGVVNVGSGILTLNGTNSYTGGTYLAPGSLVISGSAQLSPSTQTSTEWTPISAGTLALSSNLNSTAVTLAGGVKVGEYPVLTRTTMVLPGGAIFTGTPNALGSLMPGSLLLGSTTAVNFPPVISTPGAITFSASNGLTWTGTNATSYVTVGLVNSTLGTYPPLSSSLGIGTLSISSGITTIGGTLVFGGSSAGTGN